MMKSTVHELIFIMTSWRVSNKWKQGRGAIYSVYLIMFLDMFAVSLFVPHVKFRMKAIGVSDMSIGIITSAYGLVQLVSTPIMGNFADTYNRKFILLICLILTAISYIFTGITTNLIIFTAVRFVTGCFKHTQVLGKTMLAELSFKNGIHLTTLLGNSEAFGTLGFTIGPLVGGYFIEGRDGFRMLSSAAAAIFVINILLTLVLLPKFGETPISDSKEVSTKTLVQDANANLILEPAVSREIVPLVFLNFLFCLAIHIVRESAPFMLTDKYAASSLQMGYMYSMQNLASTLTGFSIGSLVSSVYKDNSKLVVVHGGILQLISALLLLNTTSFGFACMGMILQSVANQVLGVGLKYLALSGKSHGGATLGFLQTASSSSRVLAPVLVGYGGSYHDQVILMAACSALFALLGTVQFVQKLAVPKIKAKVL